jgi:hypothetical protein
MYLGLVLFGWQEAVKFSLRGLFLLGKRPFERSYKSYLLYQFEARRFGKRHIEISVRLAGA